MRGVRAIVRHAQRQVVAAQKRRREAEGIELRRQVTDGRGHELALGVEVYRIMWHSPLPTVPAPARATWILHRRRRTA